MSFIAGALLARATARRKQQVEKELTNVEKTGLKFTLDVRNAALTEMEMDVLDTMDDPLNSADFKLRALNRLIVIQMKYVALQDNPKMAKLLGAWHNAMSNWNILIEDYASVTGTYAVVEYQYVHEYEDGTVQILKKRDHLSPEDFSHQYFRYMVTKDERGELTGWQGEVKKKYAKTKPEQEAWKPLTFTPVEELKAVDNTKSLNSDDQAELARIHSDNEYFARVEMIPRGWKVYGWMHREKHTYPNTPIVIQSGPQAQGQFGQGMIMPTGSMGGGLPGMPGKPPTRGAPEVSSG